MDDYAPHLVAARAALQRCEQLFPLVACGEKQYANEAYSEAVKACTQCIVALRYGLVTSAASRDRLKPS